MDDLERLEAEAEAAKKAEAAAHERAARAKATHETTRYWAGLQAEAAKTAQADRLLEIEEIAGRAPHKHRPPTTVDPELPNGYVWTCSCSKRFVLNRHEPQFQTINGVQLVVDTGIAWANG